MHLTLILLAIGSALLLRVKPVTSASGWAARWQQALTGLVLPPLLLLSTAVAVSTMGTRGQMMGVPVGWLGWVLTCSFLLLAAGLLLVLGWQAWRASRRLQGLPIAQLKTETVSVLPVEALFAAQVGFWHPRLVVSQGLLDRLTADQLEAVLTHEQAHRYYRDTFWFFWLGWLRRLTVWLPATEALWQELLLLRELRADRWAAERCDSLLLAETLLQVTQAPLLEAERCGAAFGDQSCRLEVRVEALLASERSTLQPPDCWGGLLPALLPLLTILLHH